MMQGTFSVTIQLGNATMCEPEDVAEALREYLPRIEAGERQGFILDANGNAVGTWGFNVIELEDE